jgi:hypothetical protein
MFCRIDDNMSHRSLCSHWQATIYDSLPNIASPCQAVRHGYQIWSNLAII